MSICRFHFGAALAFYFSFQCFSFIIDRVRIQEGQYGFRRANTEPYMHFRQANTEPSMHFRTANTETYQKQNVNLSKRVGKDGVFLWLAGLCPREILRSNPASPWKPRPSLLFYLDQGLSKPQEVGFTPVTKVPKLIVVFWDLFGAIQKKILKNKFRTDQIKNW